jgi:hypothetical protein
MRDRGPTGTLYNNRVIHQQPDKLLTDYILAALPSSNAGGSRPARSTR